MFVNETAVFTCIVTGGDIGSWRLNDLILDNLPPEYDFEISSYTADNGDTHLTLQFLARAEFNGTRVQCVTFSFDGISFSETVTLLIQGNDYYTYKHV